MVYIQALAGLNGAASSHHNWCASHLLLDGRENNESCSRLGGYFDSNLRMANAISTPAPLPAFETTVLYASKIEQGTARLARRRLKSSGLDLACFVRHSSGEANSGGSTRKASRTASPVILLLQASGWLMGRKHVLLVNTTGIVCANTFTPI
jgi:hypothetical protein